MNPANASALRTSRISCPWILSRSSGSRVASGGAPFAGARGYIVDTVTHTQPNPTQKDPRQQSAPIDSENGKWGERTKQRNGETEAKQKLRTSAGNIVVEVPGVLRVLEIRTVWWHVTVNIQPVNAPEPGVSLCDPKKRLGEK